MKRLVVLLGLLAGCGNEGTGPIIHDMAVNHDLTVNMVTPIGAPGSLRTDCKAAHNPTGGTLPGGCSRQVLGAGMAGVCRQGCDIGVGTCPLAGGFAQNCYFVDESIDAMNMATGDKLKQPICIIDVPVGAPPAFIGDGVE